MQSRSQPVFMWFVMYSGICCAGGVTPKGFVHHLLMQFLTPAAQRLKFPNPIFSTSSVLNMTMPAIKSTFSGRMMCFVPYLGILCGGRGEVSPKGLVHNRVVQFFTLGNSKIEAFETFFLNILATHIDHLGYIKHLLGNFFVFFIQFGC